MRGKNSFIMKSLSIEQMQVIDGGTTGKEVASWFCKLWGAGRFLKILAFTTPVVCAVAFATDVACIIYGIADLAIDD